MSLVFCDLLDPRDRLESEKKKIQGSVNIPADNLQNLVGILPKKGSVLRVAHLAGASKAMEVLRAWGIHPVLEEDIMFGTNGLYRLWQLPTFLVENLKMVDLSTLQKCLCLGCGAGREALYLRSLGYEVVAIDILPDAIKRGIELEKATFELQVGSTTPIKWIESDVRTDLHIETMKFQVMTCLMFFHPSVVEIAEKHLHLGGNFFVETYSQDHRDATGKPKNTASLFDKEKFMNSNRWRNEFESVTEKYRGIFLKVE